MTFHTIMRRIFLFASATLVAVVLSICLTTALQVMAKDAEMIFVCNNGNVQCALVSPARSATHITTTQPVARDQSIVLTIRITAEATVLAFAESINYDVVLNKSQNPADVQNYTVTRETERTAIFTALVPPPSSEKTQTFVHFDLRVSTTEGVEGDFVVDYGSAPPPTVPTTLTLPIIFDGYCRAPDDACFEPNNSLASANPALPAFNNTAFVGSVNSTNDKTDYFRVSFTQTQPYVISISPFSAIAAGDLDMYLYNATQVVCASSVVSNSQEQIKINVKPCSANPERANTTIGPGDYSLRVIYADPPATNATVFYTITITR